MPENPNHSPGVDGVSPETHRDAPLLSTGSSGLFGCLATAGGCILAIAVMQGRDALLNINDPDQDRTPWEFFGLISTVIALSGGVAGALLTKLVIPLRLVQHRKRTQLFTMATVNGVIFGCISTAGGLAILVTGIAGIRAIGGGGLSFNLPVVFQIFALASACGGIAGAALSKFFRVRRQQAALSKST